MLERPPSRTFPNAVLAIIVASYLMIVVDVSIVITGLPKIQASLGFTAAQLSWVQNAYTLSFGGWLLLGARAGDLLGRRRMFIVGLGVFTAASVVIGLAPSASILLAARAVQGLGAAVLAPSTLALLSTHFAEGPARTRALSLYAAAAGAGATLGLVLGGLFADLVSWRAGFFINLPIGVALILAARRYIAETPKHTGQLDIAGAVTSTVGMASLVYGLVHAAEAGWSELQTVVSLLLGTALLIGFIAIERRAPQPILPIRLLASRQRSGAYLVTPQDAGAASGLVNVAHQLGGSLGLGLLVVVFAAASGDAVNTGLPEVILAHRISAVLDVGAFLMLLALAVSWFCIARPQRIARRERLAA